MMKIFKHILLSALTVTTVVSCVDDRNNFLPEDSFGFNKTANDNAFVLPIYVGSYDIDIIKSGKGFNDGTVYVSTSNHELLQHNKAFETSYIPLPADQEMYSFASESVSFTKEEVTKPLTVSWDIAKVADHMAIEPDTKYCIPIVLKSDELEVNEGRQLFVLNLVKSALTVEQKTISKTIEWESQPVTDTSSITLRLDNAIPTLDLVANFKGSESLVEEYNRVNGTNYALAPKGLVTFADSLVIKGGDNYNTLPVVLNTKVLVDPETGVVASNWDGYVLPISLSGTNLDKIDFKGNSVTFFVVKGIKPVPPQLFNRLWGLYSTSSTDAWFNYLGITDTRNITMDDEYVYVPQSAGGAAVLKAISISDPTKVKDVNVTGVSGGTHTLSCVRMLANTDETVNGGKDILIASNLSLGDGEDLHFYAWLNGIDKEPSVFRVDDANRRLGDRFIVMGEWNNGEIYTKDYNSSNVVRVGVVDGKIGEWGSDGGLSYVRGRNDYSASVSDGAAIGSAYIYPGTEGAVGGGVKSFLCTGQNTGHFYNTPTSITGTNNFTYVSAADLGMNLTYGYGFFSYNDAKYISYVVIEKDEEGAANRAAVRVIKDSIGTPDGFLTALQENKVVMDLPVQDAIDHTIASPIASSHSVGDCVVRVINGKPYMAVMAQGIGLSVFEINPKYTVE